VSLSFVEKSHTALKIPRLFHFTRELRQRTKWPREWVLEYQARRVSEIVQLCREQVPFYRKLWNEHGVKISQIQGPDDIKLLPTISKEDLKENFEQFVPDGMNRRFLNAARTGGSTGSPANFHRTMDSRLMEHAFFLRYWRWHGMNWWRDRKTLLRGAFAAPRKEIRKDWTNSYWMSVYDLTTDKLRRYARFIAEKKIAFLLAYPSLAERLAAAVADDDALRKSIRLKKVFCMSEKLYPQQRTIIEETFGVPLRIHYGHGEMAALFQQCPHGDGYHVIDDYGYTEFGPQDEPTGLREIIATGFINMATPLVRYRTGDYVRLRVDESCRCGLPFVKPVEDVEGRSGDIIVTPKGRYVQSNHLEYAIRFIKHFSDCQIIQDELDHLTILIVPEPGYTDDEGRAFAEGVSARLQEPVRIDVKVAESIERPMNQKRRFVISRIGEELLRR